MSKKKIALIGNPNCGKTTLFNVLTGTKQKVGNWPGVTVEKKTGSFSFNNNNFEVIDLPGIYSIGLKNCKNGSVDENIARNFVLDEKYDCIVNIIDSSNLERSLYLTTQLAELNVPMILVLNMLDIAKNHFIEIDLKKLSKEFKMPVIGIIAKKKNGIEDLLKLLNNFNKTKLFKTHNNNPYFNEILKQKDDNVPTHEIVKKRYDFIESVIKNSVKKSDKIIETKTDKIDKILLHKYLGLPIFFFVMYLMFLFTINISGIFIDFFDIIFGGIFVDGFKILLTSMNTPGFLKIILADGIGGGIQTVAVFIPIIAFLYLFLSFLEDSGYIARGAFVMDRLMKKLGLSGKSFIPLTIGFGCSVPAIMSTRTLSSIKDRIIVIMMTPFISCGAKLPVYVLFVTVFFPRNGQNIIFLLYLFGIFYAIFTGLLLKNTIMKNEPTEMIIDLPTYNLPRIKDIFINTWNRLKVFIFCCGKVIITIVTIITILNSFSTDGSFNNANTENAILSKIGKTITPIFKPIGVTEENWPATVGLFTGLFAKEVVVATLNTLYNDTDDINDETYKNTDTFFGNIINSFQEALATIPKNLFEIKNSFVDSLDIADINTTNLENIVDGKDVDRTTFGIMQSKFDGKIGAFAYLIFVLLYAPCIVSLAAIGGELNKFWMCITILWTTFSAYFMSVLFYQVATLYRHPLYSILWIVFCLFIFSSIIVFLKKVGNNYSFEEVQDKIQSSRCFCKKCKRKCNKGR